MDIFSKSKRSEIMSKISSKNTKPEILIRRFLFSKGFRYRKNVKELPGKPDIVLKKYKTVIFFHGCFWHGHTCKLGKLPETRKEFWQAKIESNKERDTIVEAKLKEGGWNIISIWQCEFNNLVKQESKLNSLIRNIKSGIT